MKLYYYKDAKGNFGDDINGWLWERLMPGIWDDDERHSFSGIGTILGPEMQLDRKWTIFGSGAGYGEVPAGVGGKNWDIVCVRGPLTATILNLPRELAVSDGALLIRALEEFQPVPEAERKGIVFMPHHQALSAGDWKQACDLAGIEFISPHDDSIQTLNRLRHAKLVIADAMHAAIVADTVRVPWVPVVTSLEISTFKWLDWTMSMNLPYNPIRLPQSTPQEMIRSESLFMFGKRQTFADKTIDDAMERYRAHTRMTKSWYWSPRVKLGGGLYKHILYPMAHSFPKGYMLPGSEKRSVERAAEALRKATLAPSYLSDDTHYDATLARMLSLVDEVRSRY